MARIPELPLRPYVAQNVPQNNIFYSGQVGRAVQGLGETVGNIAVDYMERQAIARDSSAVNDAMVQFEKDNLEGMNAFQKTNSGNPVGKAAEYDTQIKDQLDDIADQMPSQRARVAFLQHATRIRGNTLGQMGRWEKMQELDNFKVGAEKTSDNFNTIAYRTSNFKALPKILQDVDASKTSDATFLGESEAERLRMDRRRSVTANMFLGMIDNNVAEADRQFKSQKYDADLGSDGVVQVGKLIDQKKKQNMVLAKQLDSLKEKDPYAYMQSVGDTNGLAPLKLGTGGTTESFQQRQRYIDRARIQYGIELPVLTPQEAKTISKTLEHYDDNAATVFVQSLQRSITPEQYLPIAKQLFDENPAIGIAMSVAGDDPNTTRSIIRGNALIKNKAVAMPSDAEIAGHYFSKLGNAIADPRVRFSSLEAIKADYAAQSQAAGTASKDRLDTGLLNKSIERVVGPVLSTGKNNANTASFRGEFGATKQSRFVTQDDWDNMLDDLTEADITKAQGYMPTAINGDPISIKQLQKRGEFQAIGDGQYIVNVNGEYVPDKKGQPMIFDMKKIQQIQNNKPKSRFFGLISDAGAADNPDFANGGLLRPGQTYPPQQKLGGLVLPTPMPKNVPGLVGDGTINLIQRPPAKTMVIEDEGNRVIIPMTDEDGKLLTAKQAERQYVRTNRHFGAFSSEQAAEEYQKRLLKK